MPRAEAGMVVVSAGLFIQSESSTVDGATGDEKLVVCLVLCSSCLNAEFPHGHIGLCLENSGECCGGEITAKGGDDR